MSLGATILGLTVGAAALLFLGNLRRRQGTDVDWQVAGWTVVVLGAAERRPPDIRAHTAQLLPRVEAVMPPASSPGR